MQPDELRRSWFDQQGSAGGRKRLTGSGILFTLSNSTCTVVGTRSMFSHSPSLVPSPPPISVNDHPSLSSLIPISFSRGLVQNPARCTGAPDCQTRRTIPYRGKYKVSLENLGIAATRDHVGQAKQSCRSPSKLGIAPFSIEWGHHASLFNVIL